ncbi:ribonuclease H [Senna tora]|uniref:Ribonuclease H n=1 Tax=Senna tora TaxID=362788 RepID=A0A834XGQ4_9FABA|nr:ribonuclease H [Senna tora]
MAGHNYTKKGQNRGRWRVGTVRKVETEDLLERLANMSMRDKEEREHTNAVVGNKGMEVCEDHDGKRREIVEDVAVKTNKMEIANLESNNDEGSPLTCLQSFDGEENIKQYNFEKEEDGRVLAEIQNMEGIAEVQSHENIKENLDPKVKSLNMKMWKRMARNNGQSPKKDGTMATGGKRKVALEDMTFNDVAELNGRKVTTCKRPTNPTVVVEKVSYLLTVDGVEWDVEKICDLFNEEVCNQIVSIPPDKEQGGDRWVWEHDNKGVYSVKTGYRNAMLEEWSSFETGLDIDSEGALEQRGLRINENCAMCNNAPEDVYHAVIDCPDLQYMWVEANYDYSSRVLHANALEWLVVEAGDWKDEQISALAIASYYAWERRNKKKFCNEVVRVEELWSRVERVMDETQMVLCSSESNRGHPALLEWEKPASNFVKINVDAVLKKDGGGVLGGLLRDEHSRCLGVLFGGLSK